MQSREQECVEKISALSSQIATLTSCNTGETVVALVLVRPFNSQHRTQMNISLSDTRLWVHLFGARFFELHSSSHSIDNHSCTQDLGPINSGS